MSENQSGSLKTDKNREDSFVNSKNAEAATASAGAGGGHHIPAPHSPSAGAPKKDLTVAEKFKQVGMVATAATKLRRPVVRASPPSSALVQIRMTC